jgi:hypothetical protein
LRLVHEEVTHVPTPFIVSGEDCVRALVREDFHLVGALGGTVELRRGGESVHVPLVAALEEEDLEGILKTAGISPLRFVANLVLVHHETRKYDKYRRFNA